METTIGFRVLGPNLNSFQRRYIYTKNGESNGKENGRWNGNCYIQDFIRII